jgi:hypothetical protein
MRRHRREQGRRKGAINNPTNVTQATSIRAPAMVIESQRRAPRPEGATVVSESDANWIALRLDHNF